MQLPMPGCSESFCANNVDLEYILTSNNLLTIQKGSAKTFGQRD